MWFSWEDQPSEAAGEHLVWAAWGQVWASLASAWAPLAWLVGAVSDEVPTMCEIPVDKKQLH